MANNYGYFGSGSTGYAHYKQSFDRNFARAPPFNLFSAFMRMLCNS